LAADQSEATSRNAALRMSPLLPLAARPLPPIMVAEPYSEHGGGGGGGGSGSGGEGGGAGAHAAGVLGALVLVQEPGGVMCVAVPSVLPPPPQGPPPQGAAQQAHQPQLPPPLPLPPQQQQQQLLQQLQQRQPGALAVAAPGGGVDAAAQLQAPAGRAPRGSRGRPRS
jgi:hypothetical protein